MKKILLAVATMALVACGGKSTATLDEAQNDSLMNIVENLKAVIETAETPEVQAMLENNTELQGLVEKAVKGEISDEEKATLWQKIKGIGTEVLLGNENLKDAASQAVSEIQNANQEEIAGAAAEAASAIAGEDAATKVNEAAAKAQEVKETAEQVKETAEQVKGAIDAIKSLKK